MIMNAETPEPGNCPPGRNGKGEHIRIVRERHPTLPEVQDDGRSAAEHAARRGEPIPEFEELPRSPGSSELLGMVQEHVHEMSADDAADQSPRRDAKHRTLVQSAHARTADEQPASEPHYHGREDSKRLDV